jgi:hypothetical protein
MSALKMCKGKTCERYMILQNYFREDSSRSVQVRHLVRPGQAPGLRQPHWNPFLTVLLGISGSIPADLSTGCHLVRSWVAEVGGEVRGTCPVPVRLSLAHGLALCSSLAPASTFAPQIAMPSLSCYSFIPRRNVVHSLVFLSDITKNTLWCPSASYNDWFSLFHHRKRNKRLRMERRVMLEKRINPLWDLGRV